MDLVVFQRCYVTFAQLNGGNNEVHTPLIALLSDTIVSNGSLYYGEGVISG